MATITSHILNGLDGTHAGGIDVTLVNRGDGSVILKSNTDDGGRLSLDIPLEAGSLDCELIFKPVAYWSGRGIVDSGMISEVVLRFTLAGPDARVHAPIILSPHSYSTWKSG